MPKYRVESYYHDEFPQPPWRERGSFDNADQAISLAQSIIDKSLASAGKHQHDAADLYMYYMCYGEVPSIFNSEGLNFDAYHYLHRRIREITGDTQWQPGQLKRRITIENPG